jgi:membrane associated rhomboid family serine protease
MTPASVGFHCPECLRDGRATASSPRGGGLGSASTPRGAALRSAGSRWGPVTLVLIALNVLLFVATAISAALVGNSPLDNQNSPLFAELVQVPALVQTGQWWRVFTAAFLHYGPIHLALNMLALLLFGSELERQLGRWRFVALYVVSILGGAAALELFSDPGVAAAGASTAIYGLFGGLAVVMIATRQDLRGLLTLLAINIAISFLPGISLVGHLGGLVAGALVTTVMVVTRRRRAAQITGVVSVGVLLLALAVTAPTVLVAGF